MTVLVTRSGVTMAPVLMMPAMYVMGIMIVVREKMRSTVTAHSLMSSNPTTLVVRLRFFHREIIIIYVYIIILYYLVYMVLW